MTNRFINGIQITPINQILYDNMSALLYFLYGGSYNNNIGEYEFWKCRTKITNQIVSPKCLLVSILLQLQSSTDIANICNDIIDNYSPRNFVSYSHNIFVDETLSDLNNYKQIPSLKANNISDKQRKLLYVIGLLSCPNIPLHHRCYQILGSLLGSKTICYHSPTLKKTFSLAPNDYLFSKCGKFSFTSSKSIEWYSRKFPILEPYINITINRIITSINTRLLTTTEKDELALITKQTEKANKIFREFLTDMCEISASQIDEIIRALPNGSNCQTIYQSTPEILKKYIAESYAEKISDALAGKQTSTNECPLCYLNAYAKLPSCIIHLDPCEQKIEWRHLDNHKPKKKELCSICLTNEKKCNY